MARPAATDEQRDRQRARIRKAAADVYAKEGVLGVSVRAIAARAGVSTGTLYSYFANLQELMQSLWMEPVAEANRQLEAASRTHPDPIERIQALLTTYAEFARANPEVYRGAFLWLRPEPLARSEVLPLEDLPLYRLLCDALREGQRQGRVRRGEVGEMAQLLWAGLHGAFALPANIDRYEISPAETLAPAMIRALVRSIGA